MSLIIYARRDPLPIRRPPLPRTAAATLMTPRFLTVLILVLVLVLALIMLSAATAPAAPTARAADPTFEGLAQWLIGDGFKADPIHSIYADERVAFDKRGVSMYFVHSEGKLNYDQFTEAQPIANTRAYMETHKQPLFRAQRQYGVDREVIAAIALVETRLGTYTGNRPVVNSLSTMAALADPAAREQLWNHVSETTHLSRADFEAKARKKSTWAYGELKAFLKYAMAEGLDIPAINGSYAGAMGICQFMPSNIEKLAADGSGDGRIDLFNHSDAIMSIASYLSHHGWYPGIPRDRAYKAVYQYNHSSYYVNTILKIVELLRQGS